MNLLVVHEVSYLSKIIYEFQILPEILSLEGHRITVVDLDDTWPEARGEPIVRFRTRVHAGVHRAYPDASVTVRRPGMIRVPILSRISAAALTGVELIRLLSRERFDAVLLYGLPTVGVQTLLAGALEGVPVFFRSIDILHRLVPNPLLDAPTRALERFVYNRVRAISCVTPHLERYVLSYGVPAGRVSVMPSGVDADMFSPGPASGTFRGERQVPPDAPVVLFMGTIYTFSGLDRVIEGWKDLSRRHPGARLLVVGVGPDRERLEALAADRGITDSVIFTGFQPYDRLPEIIRSSDVCINPFELNDITRDILPTKLFQYLGCGRPVLATSLPGTTPFLPGEDQGMVYEGLNGFMGALDALLGDRDRRERLGAAGATWVRARYDWREIARQTVGWIEEHAAGPPR